MNSQSKFLPLTSLTILAISLASIPLSQAAVVVTGSNPASYTVASPSLINAGAATLASGPTLAVGSTGFGSLSNLNNGTVPPSLDINASWGAPDNASATVTFNLNTTLNPGGYDIYSIQTLVDWQGDLRSNQNYSVYYTTVSNNTPLLLATVAYNPYINGDPNLANGRTQVIINDSALAALASGVNSLSFTIAAAQSTIFTEWTVTGNATAVPEPSAWVLLLSSVGVLAFLRRRQVGFSRR